MASWFLSVSFWLWETQNWLTDWEKWVFWFWISVSQNLIPKVKKKKPWLLSNLMCHLLKCRWTKFSLSGKDEEEWRGCINAYWIIIVLIVYANCSCNVHPHLSRYMSIYCRKVPRLVHLCGNWYYLCQIGLCCGFIILFVAAVSNLLYLTDLNRISGTTFSSICCVDLHTNEALYVSIWTPLSITFFPLDPCMLLHSYCCYCTVDKCILG